MNDGGDRRGRASGLLLHGLRFETEFPFPAEPWSGGEPDVRIVAGAVPPDLPGAVIRGGLFQSAPGRYLLNIPGVARFLVVEGKHIVVDANPSSTTTEILTFLLGSAVAAVLHQRDGYLVLHGSAVAGAAGAVVVLGHSGRGKSTVVTTLSNRGYQLLADDIAALTIHAGDVVVHPGVPQVRLWADTLNRLGVSSTALERAKPRQEKFVLPLPPGRPLGATPVTAIWVLELAPSGDVRVETLENSTAFHVLRTLTRNVKAVEGLGTQPSHFLVGAAVAAQVPVRRLWRARGIDTCAEVASIIEGTLR